MSAKRLSRGAKALRGSYEAASHLREAIGEHNMEFSCPAASTKATWNCQTAFSVRGGLPGDNCNDLLGVQWPECQHVSEAFHSTR